LRNTQFCLRVNLINEKEIDQALGHISFYVFTQSYHANRAGSFPRFITPLDTLFSPPGITVLFELLILEHPISLNLGSRQSHPLWAPKKVIHNILEI
jgi:hypothetical protein